MNKKELVKLVREPRNQYDRNAVRVDNIRGEHVGHMPRFTVCHLAPLMDGNTVTRVDGVVFSGNTNKSKVPVVLFVWGTPANKAEVTRRLGTGGSRLRPVDEKAASALDGPLTQMAPGETERQLDSLFHNIEAQKQTIRSMEPGPTVRR